MKVIIEDGCIGCGLCTELCPEVFSLSEEGTAQVSQKEAEQNQEKVKEAQLGCPVEVIKTTDC